jgi:hypothetical protein
MTVSLDDVTRIIAAVAAERSTAVDAITIASADAESGRVELLVALAGCSAEPCRILLNIDRKQPEALEAELRSKLAEAIAAAASHS